MATKRKADEVLEPAAADVASSSDSESVSSSDSEPEEEDIGKILEPFTKDQLIDLLRSAASNDPDLVSEIHGLADLEPAHRKLFVHGLGWETTTDKLRDSFAKYGEIEECNIVLDKNTGKSKGYGFVLFKHRHYCQKALRNPQKKIDNRMTACQLASIGPTNPQPNLPPPQVVAPGTTDVLARKIYVGNVSADISPVKLHSFFSKYGDIEEGPLGLDKHTGKPKGFALFIYKNVDGARKALEEPNKTFEGHYLYCQKATDSQKIRTAAAAAPPPVPTSVPPTGYSNGMDGQPPASSTMLGQGLLAPSMPFPTVNPNQAALAVLAAAGQNPAAFGLTPAVLAAISPALAAAMNQASMNPAPQQMGPTGMVHGLHPYGAGTMGYHSAGYHSNSPQLASSYQTLPPGQRQNTGLIPMGGYGLR